MSGECVFDLLGSQPAADAYPPDAAAAARGAGSSSYSKKKTPLPTASTFGLHGTSAVVGNAGGEMNDYSVHPHKKPVGTFGREVGSTVDPSNYLKKNEGPYTASRGTATVNSSKFVKSERCHEKRKADVPSRSERPVMGLKTDKNYVVANAVENTLAIPTKETPAVRPRPTDREDFGKVPQYLQEIKDEIAARRDATNAVLSETKARNEKWTELTEKQLSELRNGLQQRWDKVNKEYQSKSFGKNETPSQKQQRERLEKELCALEFAMQKVGRNHVFVYDDICNISRVLTESSLRREYKPSKETSLDNVVVKGLHFGQRKLLLSEIEFLTAIMKRRADKEKSVLAVYAGAANGSHLPFLFELFPDVEFVLIDPAPFCEAVRDLASRGKKPIVELLEDYCTDETCLRLARTYGDLYDIYLISDIRSGVPKKMETNAEHTSMMLRDNEWQRNWCWALRAEAAMLKFHPPYPPVRDTSASNYDPLDDTPESIEYLDGEALFGVWAPKSSSEVRLVVQGPFTDTTEAKLRRYGCTEHEEQCYYYNTHDRYARDCKAERLILSKYLQRYPATAASAEELSARVSIMLRFPLFRPLAPDFSESHARWMFLACSSRHPKAADVFETYKTSMSVETVKHLVTEYATCKAVPTDVLVGSHVLSEEFWVVFCRGDFAEAYSFPRVRWGFHYLTVKRENTRDGRQGGERKARRRISENGSKAQGQPSLE